MSEPNASGLAASQAHGDNAEHVPGWFIYTIKQLELGLRSPIELATQQENGFTAAQYTALSVLARWPGITSSELARRSFVRPQSMAETVTPLIEAGYVRRQEEGVTGRRYPLFLTEAGNAMLTSADARVSELETALLAAVPTEDREQFAKNLRACRNALANLPR